MNICLILRLRKLVGLSVRAGVIDALLALKIKLVEPGICSYVEDSKERVVCRITLLDHSVGSLCWARTKLRYSVYGSKAPCHALD
jgi:hypothetical protein